MLLLDIISSASRCGLRILSLNLIRDCCSSETSTFFGPEASLGACFHATASKVSPDYPGLGMVKGYTQRSTFFISIRTIWSRKVMTEADAKMSYHDVNNCNICPVLKHGPRSLTYLRVCE